MALPVAASAPPSQIVFAVAAAGIAAGVSYRMIRADGLFTIAAAGAAALFANGVVAALVLLWSIARPAHAGKVARAGLLAAAAGSAAWIALVYVRGNALVDARLVRGLLRSSFIFPWSGIQYLLTEQPVVTAVIMLGVWRGAFAAHTRRAIPARMLALLLYLELLSFGVTGMDVRARFLVLIMPLIAAFAGAGMIWLARIAADAVSRRSPLLARIVLVTTVIAAVGYVLAEQAAAIVPHRDPVSGAAWWTRWSPSVALSSLAIDRDMVAPDDLIVTNDELAALLVLGRMDYWWPPDSTSAERYTFTDQRGGQRRGIYGGAPVLPDLAAVQLLIQQRQTRAVVVALFNTGKFGFDPSNLLGLIDEHHTVELERSNDWFVARFPARP